MLMPEFCVSCLAFLLTLAACAASPGPAAPRGDGYGPPPEHASSAIATHFHTAGPPLLSAPDPYPLNLDGRWIYGWRVCARDTSTGQLGLFLFRREEVIFHAVGDDAPDSRDSVLADRHCSGRVEF